MAETVQQTRQKYVLTDEQFQDLRLRLSNRFEAENIDAAYQVMVLDRPVIQVANELKKSRQNLHRVVRDIWEVHQEEAPKIPATWVRVAVTLPPDMARSVKELEAAQIAKLDTAKGKK